MCGSCRRCLVFFVFFSILFDHVNTSVCWERAAASLLLGLLLICLPVFSSHCLSCSDLTHDYTSSNIPESPGWVRPLWVCALTTPHNSSCVSCIEVRDCERRLCSSFLLVIEWGLFRRATPRLKRCSCWVKTLSIGIYFPTILSRSSEPKWKILLF